MNQVELLRTIDTLYRLSDEVEREYKRFKEKEDWTKEEQAQAQLIFHLHGILRNGGLSETDNK